MSNTVARKRRAGQGWGAWGAPKGSAGSGRRLSIAAVCCHVAVSIGEKNGTGKKPRDGGSPGTPFAASLPGATARRWFCHRGLCLVCGFFFFMRNKTNFSSKGAIFSRKDEAGCNLAGVAQDGGDMVGTSSPRHYLAGCHRPPVLTTSVNPGG